MSKYRKKLIEVALPLDAINKESAREKSIRHGHPSTLHLWWARRPLAACRAVLFSSLVNDPEDDPMYGVDKEVAYTERAKLFNLIEELVKWENSNNPTVINAARLEIARSIAANMVADKELQDDTPLVANAPELPEEQAKYLPDPPAEYAPHDVRFKMPSLKPEQVNHFLAHYAPPVLDPFAGGGSIPLEAQRLGLRAYASDLNPVPVLINKALIEIPPKFAGLPPVNPDARKGKLKNAEWRGAQGLADDVRYYGKWMRDEADKRIGHLYPKVKVTEAMAASRSDLKPYGGKELTVIAWLWARTVPSPDPGFANLASPLMASFWLSKKKGKELWVEIVKDSKDHSGYRFEVRAGHPSAAERETNDSGTKIGRGGNFRCALSGTPIPVTYIREQGQHSALGSRMFAIVCEGTRERVYVNPDSLHVSAAMVDRPADAPDQLIAKNPRDIRCQLYGIESFAEIFTPRQLTALMTVSSLVQEVRGRVVKDAQQSASSRDVNEYGNAISTYLGLVLSRYANYSATLCSWSSHAKDQMVKQVFGRQALPMAWDYGELNPLSNAGGTLASHLKYTADAIPTNTGNVVGVVRQADSTSEDTYGDQLVATDPPYYDNIQYADLSDFFYVWLRRALRDVYPTILGTMLTPKSDELVANPYRHDGNNDCASKFFEGGLGRTIGLWRKKGNAHYPCTIFYAFKQAETDSHGTSSTGWETFLAGVVAHGFAITATWPIRTELTGNLKKNVSALASSIVLACVPREEDASVVSRRDFANALRKELPEAIKHLQSGNVAPVDLAQASIGPGMGIFSRYKQVVNADGTPMSVREALQMINQTLDEALNEQEADFDSETRFAVRWFEQFGMQEGPYGQAEVLATAMAVAVSGVVEAGILKSGRGKVRLLKRDELSGAWNPATDRRSTIWECTQHLIRRLEVDGESAAAELLAEIQESKGGEAGEVARELSYRLYSTCERRNRAADALSYNGLVVSWPEIGRLARELKGKAPQAQQQEMF